VSLRNHPNSEIAEFSRRIVEELATTEGILESEVAQAEPLVPSFEAAMKEFVRFIVGQGFPPNLLWINRTDVVASKRRGRGAEFVWKGDPTQRERQARAEYQRAAARHTGVAFEARSRTKRWTICRVYVPVDDRDAELRMIPKTGAKYSAADRPLPTVLVENGLRWSLLNLWKDDRPDPWD
jgi:hypothetical protein